MEPLLTTRQVAELLGVEPGSLEVARATGKGFGHDIPVLKIGRTIRYRPEAVRASVDKQVAK